MRKSGCFCQCEDSILYGKRGAPACRGIPYTSHASLQDDTENSLVGDRLPACAASCNGDGFVTGLVIFLSYVAVTVTTYLIHKTIFFSLSKRVLQELGRSCQAVLLRATGLINSRLCSMLVYYYICHFPFVSDPSARRSNRYHR